MREEVKLEIIEEQKNQTGVLPKGMGAADFDVTKDYAITDPVIQRVARERLYNNYYDYRGQARDSYTDESDILTKYLGTDLGLLEIRKQVGEGAVYATRVEQINVSGENESIVAGQAFARMISKDTSNISDLLTYKYVREMKKKDIPAHYQSYFQGGGEDTIEKMIEDGTFDSEQFNRLYNEARTNTFALEVQPLTENFASALDFTSFEHVVDSQSFEVIKKPTASYYLIQTLPALAEEAVAEIDVDLQDVLQYVPDDYQPSYASWYKGGQQSIDEYRRLRAENLSRGTKSGFHDLNILFGDEIIFNDLRKYVDQRSEQDNGDATMSYDNLYTYTMEFLEAIAANEEDGRLTPKTLEYIKSKGHLEDVKTIYGKALATAMTGELDHIPFNIGTPAGMDYYLQRRSDNYTGLRHPDSTWALRVTDSLAHEPLGFQEGYTALAAGFGFTTGSVHQAHMNTGTYLSVIVPFENMAAGAIGKAGRTAYRPMKALREGETFKTAVGEFAEELSPTAAAMGRGFIRDKNEPPEGGKRYMQDPKLLQDIAKEQEPERLLGDLAAGAGGTALVGAVSGAVFGWEGAALSMIFNNSPGRQFIYNVLLKGAGATDFTKKAAALPEYYKRRGEYNNWVARNAYKRNQQVIESGNNPVQDLIQGSETVASKVPERLNKEEQKIKSAERELYNELNESPSDKALAERLGYTEDQLLKNIEEIAEAKTNRPAKTYYKKDAFEKVINQFGLSMKEVLAIGEDLVRSNVRQRGKIVAKILAGDKSSKISRSIAGLSERQKLETISGRENLS